MITVSTITSWKPMFRFLLLGFIIFFVDVKVQGQVAFTQSSNADFNAGAADDAIIASNSIYLPNKASNPGLWWTGTSFLPSQLAGHATVTSNYNYVYLLGGYDGSSYSNMVYKANIQSTGISAWSAVSSLPEGLRDAAVVVGTHKIYVLGGRNGSQVFDNIYYADINSDGSLGSWQSSAISLPENLWGHSAVHMNGNIYVIGGSSQLADTTAQNTVYYSRLDADNIPTAFITGTSLPESRSMHGTATYNGKIYISGGYDNFGVKQSSVYASAPDMDGPIGAWTSDASLPVNLSNHACVASNGLIVVLGGASDTSLSSAVYYADLDQGYPLSWQTSTNTMFDYIKDGAAFAGNGQVIYAGGYSQSGGIMSNSRYATFTMTSDYIGQGSFISYRFDQLGTERPVDSLVYNASYTSPFANCQVSYRLAGSDKAWGSWSIPTSSKSIHVNDSDLYVQYKVILSGQGSNNSTFHDLSLYTAGTPLSGNLNSIDTFRADLSPYVVFSTISFTSGTHIFEPGVTFLFSPGTGMNVTTASLISNGNASDSVKFMNLGVDKGLWNGIYFQSSSDNGVSSQFYYTVIANAGSGGNNSNLRCYSTSQPYLSHCHIKGAHGNGILLYDSDLTIQNSTISGNTENGVYISSSSPTITISEISGNQGAGIYSNTTTSILNGSTIENNMYGIRYTSPNQDISIPIGSPLIVNNTYNGIALDGGNISGSDKTWQTLPYDYNLLGGITIREGGSVVKLNILPGNTIRVASGHRVQIGDGYAGGELEAIGTSASPITFSSMNGMPGGWNGIYFSSWSDNYGGFTEMRHCIIENGKDYNLYSTGTSQPEILDNCIIRNAEYDGVRLDHNSLQANTITNCQFLNNGRYPLYFMNSTSNPVHHNNSFSGNGFDNIVLSGGTYQSDYILSHDDVPYLSLNNMLIGYSTNNPALIIRPGVTLEFLEGNNLQIGQSYNGGELYAVGTADSLITFKPHNDSVGGWNGIYFQSFNDNYGAVSTMKYCIVEKAASQNIYIENSAQPEIDKCTIRHSAMDGIVLTSSTCPISNSHFSANQGYPLVIANWDNNSVLSGNTYAGNGMQYISFSGGTITSDRRYYNDGIPYHIHNDIFVYSGADLSLDPGVTFAMDKGTSIQLGTTYNGASLNAIGTEDSIITFMAFNDSIGGWEGIYFHSYNDNYGATSTLKHCHLKQGNSYNLYVDNSAQPLVNQVSFSHSAGNGLSSNNSPLSIRNSSFINNQGHGIHISGSQVPTLGDDPAYSCNFYNNGHYNVFNESSSDVNARYNYWTTGNYIQTKEHIFDKDDSVALGLLYVLPVLDLPWLGSDSMLVSGSLHYAYTSPYVIEDALLSILDTAGTAVDTVSSNSLGEFSFEKIARGRYTIDIAPDQQWNGVNSTDALMMMHHFAHISRLSGLPLAAADVNNSLSVNATDALFAMNRFVGNTSSFPAGDYVKEVDSLSIDTAEVMNHYSMLWMGDVNASYNPSPKSSGNFLALSHEQTIPLITGAEFVLPVRTKDAMDLGAISLGLYYPEEWLEPVGVIMANGDKDIPFSTSEGLLRLAWCDLDAIAFDKDDVILNIAFRTLDISSLYENINIELYEHSEFADANANPYSFVHLEIPQLQHKSFKKSEHNGLEVYPNPISESASISYFLDGESDVVFSICDIRGKEIQSFSTGILNAGSHQTSFDASHLDAGVYLLRVTYQLDGIDRSMVKKLIVKR